MNLHLQYVLASADIWEELGDDGYYLGFVVRGADDTNLNLKQMKICLITPKSSGVQQKLWANGDNLYYDYRWAQRTAYTYQWAK